MSARDEAHGNRKSRRGRSQYLPKKHRQIEHTEKNVKQKKEGTYFDVPLRSPLQIEAPVKHLKMISKEYSFIFLRLLF